jgi:hypothetical protein
VLWVNLLTHGPVGVAMGSEPFPVAEGWLVRGDTPTAGR